MQARLRKKRNGECICKCKAKRIFLDCGLIENGGFVDGGNWKVDSRGDAISEVTDDDFFSHYPSNLPLGVNRNFQGGCGCSQFGNSPGFAPLMPAQSTRPLRPYRLHNPPCKVVL